MASVGDNIEVYWPDDEEYYAGIVASVNATTGYSLIHYDDDEKEELNLSKEQWRFSEKFLEFGKKCSNDSISRTLSETIRTSKQDKQAEISRARRAWTVAARKVKNSGTGVTKKSTFCRSKRLMQKPSSSKRPGLQVESLFEGTGLDFDPVELLIKNAVESWLRSESRRQSPSSIFSAVSCLENAKNVLAEALTDPKRQQQLKRSENSNSNWIITGITSDKEQRYRYHSWIDPMSDEEWTMEKQLLNEISEIILDRRGIVGKKKFRHSLPGIKAVGVLDSALVLAKTMRKDSNKN